MTIEEAREYWSRRLERASGYSDEHWDAEERHAHKEYIDALKHAVTALAICREREETEKKPKTVRRGRWIPRKPDCRGYTEAFMCSECKAITYMHYCAKDCEYDDFCPNCGADMREGGADNG